jgi:hypothetical protein
VENPFVQKHIAENTPGLKEKSWQRSRHHQIGNSGGVPITKSGDSHQYPRNQNCKKHKNINGNQLVKAVVTVPKGIFQIIPKIPVHD